MQIEDSKNGDRIEYIDIAKALGIILVIAGHVVSADTEIKRVLYSFHMPLFFILSGMLLKSKEEYSFETWKRVVAKKLKALMLPYFAWALVYTSFSFKHLALIVYGTRETLILAESLTSLWFLPVMFLSSLYAELTLVVFSKVGKYREIVMAIGFFACFLIGFIFPHNNIYGDPWGLDIAFVAVVFMLIGMQVRKGIYLIKKTIWMVVATVVVCVVFIGTVRYSSSPFGYVLMANAEYGNPFVFLENAIEGSLLVILVSWLITVFFRKTWLLQWLGARTLGIFVIHKPIVELCRNITTKIGLSFNDSLIVIIITLITLALSGTIVSLIEHILPEIIGLKTKIENTKKEC